MEKRNWTRRESLPCNLSRYTPHPRSVTNGDFYVSPFGKNLSSGTYDNPFRSLSQARDAIREKRKSGDTRRYTVSVLPGTYCFTEPFVLSAEDSDVTYSAYDDEKPIFSGGITVKKRDIEHYDGDIWRFDLKKYGITGNFSQYDFFFNGHRASTTTYPYDGFLRTGKVTQKPGNGAPGSFIVDKETAEHISQWENIQSCNMYGYFAVDWSDARVQITDYDPQNAVISAVGFDFWGLNDNCPYRFENIKEELKYPNQYYIDTETAMCYLIPDCDTDDLLIEISDLSSPFFDITADNVEITGFDFRIGRDKGININGTYNKVYQCHFERIGGNCIEGTGTGNKVQDCVFEHISKTCVVLFAGDRPSLTPGFAEVDNCLFHDFGEVTKTGCHAVSINGVHNKVSHCEIYNAPYACIHYSGQDHLIEYNYAHNVVQNSSDMGITYSGFHWDSQGCVLRYNCFCNLGNEQNTANGIYWDDMLSGQIGYGNIIINPAGDGFHIGGGRDHLNYNNIVLNAGGASLYYDARGTDWEADASMNPDSGIWKNLKSEPYKSDKWADKFPNVAKIDEKAPIDSPNCPATPSGSRFSGNVYISMENYCVSDTTRRYSYIGNNVCMDIDDDPGFVDRKNGNYNFRPDSPVFVYLPGFENLPFEKMGRY